MVIRDLLFIVLAVLAPAVAVKACCADDLPLVTEHVDELCVFQVANETFSGHPQIVFIRDGQVMAKRLVYPSEMIFYTDQEGRFVVQWRDYSICHRVVTADHYSYMVLPEDPTHENGPWWAMQRNMRDLKQPEQP